jgi:outer membrane cobalamin receptor
MKYPAFCTKIFIILLSVSALAAPASRGQKEGTDTLRTIPMKEVVVTATRSPLPADRSPSRVSVLSKEEIDLRKGETLGELVSDMPGLFVRAYGAGGELQTASFRGMAGEETLVLLDGVPLNSAQYGLVDLRLVPASRIGRIELSRGGSSALYGANALGGIINIFTLPPGTVPAVSLDASAGSFGESGIGLRASVSPSEEWRLLAGGSTRSGSGNYPFLLSDGGGTHEEVRTDSDYRERDLYLKSSWSPSPGRQAEMLVSYSTLDRGTPGPFVTAASQGMARQADDQIQAIGSLMARGGDRWGFSLSGGFQNSYEHYAEYQGIFPADNFYRNITATLHPEARFEPSRSAAVVFGMEGSRASASGNALREEKIQYRGGVSIGSELAADSIGIPLSLFPSLRFDRSTGVEDAWSPKIGLNLRLAPDVTLHSTAGRDFRPPTINELYYAGAGGHGNPSLRPERSLSFDAGMTLDFPLVGDQEFDVTYYSITTDDRIFWQPAGSQLDWSPANIGETKSTGLELEYRWDLPGRLFGLSGNYSLINARKKSGSGAGDPSYDKQLIYVPLETANASATFRIPFPGGWFNGFHIRVDGEYVGDRYTVEDNSAALRRYVLIGGNIGMEFSLGGGVRADLRYAVKNAGREPYEVIPRYPMPLDSHTVSCSITRSE